MGGKKKLSLKQMERMQARKGEEEKEKEKKKKDKAGVTPSKDKSSDIILPDLKSEKIIGDLRKMPVLTPYTVASRFGVRISVAKDLLERLEENGIVQFVSGNHDIKIYKPVD